MNANKSHYAAILDGDIEGASLRTTRGEAEADARWLLNHPARRDRVAMGWGRVRVAEVVEDEWTGEWIIAE